MMYRLCSYLLFCLSFSFSAQIETGSWRLHTATKQAIDVATNQEEVLIAYQNGVLKYHLDSKEKTLLNKMNGLSDILLSTLYFDSIRQVFYIGYTNGNIDVVQGRNIINIPAIRLANLPGSKKIIVQSWPKNPHVNEP